MHMELFFLQVLTKAAECARISSGLPEFFEKVVKSLAMRQN